MSLHTWTLFVVMTFFVSATPGPNMILVMTHSARHGWRAATATMAGCMTALVAMMALSAFGMGTVLTNFPRVFDALRLIGATYLAWLGVKLWRAPVEQEADALAAVEGTAANLAAPADAGTDAPTSDLRRSLYRQGLLVAASNPKAILFAAAFFPQFIEAGSAQWPQFALLLATFSVIEVSWYLIYAAGGRTVAQALRQPRVLRLFNRISGGLFVAFAALMAVTRH
jgi:threonine/homoserine/homoserine lactone efflux protein